MNKMPSHKQGCCCQLCEQLRRSNVIGKKKKFSFCALPELAETILKKSEQAGLTPGKWIEQFVEHALEQG